MKDPPGRARISVLAAFAAAFWRNKAILNEPPWKQERLFLRSALAILTH